MAEYKENLADMLDYTTEKYPDREAIVFKGKRLNYKEFQALVNQMAKGLLKLGVKKGDNVAIWMPNSIEWAIVEFAILKIGGVIIPINTRYKREELDYILRQSDATTLIMKDEFLNINFMETIYEVCPELKDARPGKLNSSKFPSLKNVICHSQEHYEGFFYLDKVIEMGEDWRKDDSVQKVPSSLDPEDVALIPYTSGTTGFPKGAMTTHGQIYRILSVMGKVMGMNERDRIIIPTPFYHNMGNMAGIINAVRYGACAVPLEIFDPEETLRVIQEEKCTFLLGSPTIYIMMLEHPNFQKYNLKSMRAGIIGAAPIPTELVKEIMDKIGMKLAAGYGMTENSAVTSLTHLDDPPEIIATTVGPPLPGFEVCIKDPASGKKLPAGEQGELCTKGYFVMKGYYKMPKETARCYDEEGWFHTGDLAVMDEKEYLKITGRLKDMYISGGVNVYPVEVEDFLYKHPKVKQAYVIGVPDHRLGEVGMAFIELKEGEQCSEQEILDYCRGRIANYKIPKHIRFTGDFPMTPTGKVQKFMLRERALEELESRD